MNSIETIKRSINVLENMASWEDSDLKLEAIGVAISELHKQIPINPIIKSYSPALCPACNTELSESKGDGYYKHYYDTSVCNCGQKIKWQNKD